MARKPVKLYPKCVKCFQSMFLFFEPVKNPLIPSLPPISNCFFALNIRTTSPGIRTTSWASLGDLLLARQHPVFAPRPSSACSQKVESRLLPLGNSASTDGQISLWIWDTKFFTMSLDFCLTWFNRIDQLWKKSFLRETARFPWRNQVCY